MTNLTNHYLPVYMPQLSKKFKNARRLGWKTDGGNVGDQSYIQQQLEIGKEKKVACRRALQFP